jgi:uncharacterized protein YcfL
MLVRVSSIILLLIIGCQSQEEGPTKDHPQQITLQILATAELESRSSGQGDTLNYVVHGISSERPLDMKRHVQMVIM